MRKLALIFTWMLLCHLAFAQKQPTVSIDTSGKRLVFKDPPNLKDRPYVLINDKEYKGKLENIDQGSIASVDVIKPPDAESIYGIKAVNGVIRITTKEPVELENIPLPPSGKRNNVILNGQKADIDINAISPDSIFNIDVLVKPKFIDSKIMDTTVVITTRRFADEQYKLKLSKRSAEYKAYLAASKNGDNDLTYTLNGAEVTRDESDDFLRTMFGIPEKKIISVAFHGRHYMGIRKNEYPIIVIITNKY